MNRYEIGVIPGDGIGIEVMREGTKLLKTLETTHGVECNLEYFDWGATYYKQHGVMMSPDGLDRLRPKDALLLGAVGHPDIQNHITLNGLLLPLRRNFDQYACVRPIELLPNVETPLAGKTIEDIDFLVVRENTEGEYSNVGGFQYKDFPQEVASRPMCSRALGANGSHALRLNWRSEPTVARLPQLPSQTRRATVWSFGTRPSQVSPKNFPRSKTKPTRRLCLYGDGACPRAI